MAKKRTTDPAEPPADGPQPSRAELFLAAASDQIEDQLAQRRQALADAITAKRAQLDAGDAVPHDKRPI